MRLRVDLTEDQEQRLLSMWSRLQSGDRPYPRSHQWIKRRRAIRDALGRFLEVHLQDDLPKHFPLWYED